jgi:hypothetical protein
MYEPQCAMCQRHRLAALVRHLSTTTAAAPPQQQRSRKVRVALIGNSQAGGFGHGLEKLFVGREDGEVIAVADPHPTLRQKVVEAISSTSSDCSPPRQYDCYHAMLAAEATIDVVVIATRWTEEHYDMAMAALRAGAHVFMEKPFVHVLSEADELVALARCAHALWAHFGPRRIPPPDMMCAVYRQEKTAALCGQA